MLLSAIRQDVKVVGMLMTTLFKIFTLLTVYLVGQFFYDTIYSWTLKIVSFLTNDKLHFFGKLWDFAGKPSFGLVILLLPILGYLGIKKLGITNQLNLLKYWIIDVLLISSTYFLVCYVYACYLLNRIQEGKIQADNYTIPLSDVNVFIVAALSITTGTMLTFMLFKFGLRKRPK